MAFTYHALLNDSVNVLRHVARWYLLPALEILVKALAHCQLGLALILACGITGCAVSLMLSQVDPVALAIQRVCVAVLVLQ